MSKSFDLKTVTLLLVIMANKEFPVKALVKGKYIGGKRWKRRYISLTKEEYREVKLNNILK